MRATTDALTRLWQIKLYYPFNLDTKQTTIKAIKDFLSPLICELIEVNTWNIVEILKRKNKFEQIEDED